jgi:hypothetical protein
MNHIQWDSQQPGVAACCLLHAKSVTFPKPEALIYVQSYGQVVFLINTNALLNGVVPHSRENKMSYFNIRGFPWRLFSFKISDNIKALLSVFKLN